MKVLAAVQAISLLDALLTHGQLSTDGWNILISVKAYLGAQAFDGIHAGGSVHRYWAYSGKVAA